MRRCTESSARQKVSGFEPFGNKCVDSLQTEKPTPLYQCLLNFEACAKGSTKMIDKDSLESGGPPQLLSAKIGLVSYIIGCNGAGMHFKPRLTSHDAPTNTHFFSSRFVPIWAKCEPSVSLITSFGILGNLRSQSVKTSSQNGTTPGHTSTSSLCKGLLSSTHYPRQHP